MVPSKTRDFPLSLRRLRRGERAQVALNRGGLLLQLQRPRPWRQASRRSIPRAEVVHPVLLAIDGTGQNGTLLFDGRIAPLPAEVDVARRPGEPDLPASQLTAGHAVSGIWQTATRAGVTLWLQTVGRLNGRDMGLALWRQDAKDRWRRQAIILPRTSAEGRWQCLRAGEHLRCDFIAPALPGVRRFQSRVLRRSKHTWRPMP